MTKKGVRAKLENMPPPPRQQAALQPVVFPSHDIAVVLAGQLRAAACWSPLESATPMQTFRNNVLQPLQSAGVPYEVLAVLDTGKDGHNDTAAIRETLTVARPVAVHFEDSAAAAAEHQAYKADAAALPSMDSVGFYQSRKSAIAWAMLLAREGARGRPYTHVLRTRPDNLFRRMLPLAELLRPQVSPPEVLRLRRAGFDDRCLHRRGDTDAKTCFRGCSGGEAPDLVAFSPWGQAFMNDIFFVVARHTARPFLDHMRMLEEHRASRRTGTRTPSSSSGSGSGSGSSSSSRNSRFPLPYGFKSTSSSRVEPGDAKSYVSRDDGRI